MSNLMGSVQIKQWGEIFGRVLISLVKKSGDIMFVRIRDNYE